MFQTANQLINQLYTMRSYETMEHHKINVYIPLNGIPTQWFPMLIVSHEKLFISFYHIPVSTYNSCPLTLRLVLLIQFKHCITNPKSANISCWWWLWLLTGTRTRCVGTCSIPVYSQIVIWSGKMTMTNGEELCCLAYVILFSGTKAKPFPMIFTLIFLCFVGFWVRFNSSRDERASFWRGRFPPLPGLLDPVGKELIN